MCLLRTSLFLDSLFISVEDLFLLGNGNNIEITDKVILDFVLQNFIKDDLVETITINEQTKYWVNFKATLKYLQKIGDLGSLNLKLAPPIDTNLFKYISYDAFARQAAQLSHIAEIFNDLNQEYSYHNKNFTALLTKIRDVLEQHSEKKLNKS